ncbi:MAG: TIGR02147 family protein [Bacteriovoracaceae bacterium]|jgi:uncharacterized protein (TIGR02147 family)|nr:TIGR02147 family protein [Bacteriovoracaceae bacterium]
MIQDNIGKDIQKDEKNPSDLRIYLQQELLRRCRINPNYSLRAFARSAGINHSTLSQIIRGKRPLTEKSILKLCKGLNFGPEETSGYIEGFRETTGKDVNQKNYHQLTIDAFQVISDWYHWAILELIKVQEFQASSKWISKVLGISINEVNVAIERLKRLEILEVDENGKWNDHSDGFTTIIDKEFTNIALKKYQKQLLEKAANAMDDTDRDQRDQSSMTMAVNVEKMPEAKKIIKKFRRDLCDLLEDGNRQEVYQLVVSLFPLGNVKKGRSTEESEIGPREANETQF